MRVSRLALIIWIVMTTAAAAQGSSPLARTLEADVLGNPVVWVPSSISTGLFAARIAQAGHVPVVFEAIPHELPYTGSQQRLDLTGVTVQEALHQFVSADARYQWHEADGVIVIRPVAASTDDANPLNQPVTGVDWSDVGVHEALDRLVSLINGGTPPPTPAVALDARTFSVSVASGSVLEVMVAIARAHGAVVWTTPDRTQPGWAGGVSFGVSTFDGRQAGAVAVLSPAGQ